MPTIGIDYTPAYEQGGGIGRLVRDLVGALTQLNSPHDYRLFVAGASDMGAPLADNFVWRPTRITPKWLARMWHRARLPYPVENIVGDVDLYHATDFVLPPTRSRTKSIVTVHDLSFVRVPDSASPSLREYLDAVVPRSVYQADFVIADSYATADDIKQLYDVESEVLWSGVDERFVLSSLDSSLMTIRNKYRIPEVLLVFTVGTVQPRKNYSRLIRAIKRLRDGGLDVRLVIAGGKGWLEDEMYQTIKDTQMADYVHLLGFVDDDDLPALYQLADCVAFPSLYEGFGFPVLESMASRTPVVTSNVSSLPEVAGDAALMVDPYSIDEIAEAIGRILTDEALRDDLIAKGIEQASKFTWEKSAKQLLDIYDRVLNS